MTTELDARVRRILLADDDQNIAKIAVKMLSKVVSGLHFVSPTDVKVFPKKSEGGAYYPDIALELIYLNTGDTALSEILAGKLDAAILDYHMPKESGIEVLSKARQAGIQTPAGMPIPIYLFTGHGEKLNEALSARATGVILKEEVSKDYSKIEELGRNSWLEVFAYVITRSIVPEGIRLPQYTAESPYVRHPPEK